MNHFKGKQFKKDVIIVAVGYYLRYNLSYREVQELLYDRGINVCHTTIYRWVQEYSKVLYYLWKKKNRQSFYSWKMDETYIKIKGRWHYLYRAIDADGLTLDIWLRKKRDTQAAYAFLKRLHKTISRIKATKKQILKESKREEDLALDEEELRLWLKAFDDDLNQGLIEFKDYVLFYTTFFLSDRKSESYALQWKHIDFNQNEILIENALDRFGNVKSTKGGKKTLFNAPLELMRLLKEWKAIQREELKLFGIKQTNNQFVFTYNDRSNNINKVVHIDYLNYRMNSIKRRHPELAPATPHKLRHTAATLAKKAGRSIDEISEALTHSDQSITKTYINTKSTVKQTVGETAFRIIKKN